MIVLCNATISRVVIEGVRGLNAANIAYLVIAGLVLLILLLCCISCMRKRVRRWKKRWPRKRSDDTRQRGRDTGQTISLVMNALNRDPSSCSAISNNDSEEGGSVVVNSGAKCNSSHPVLTRLPETAESPPSSMEVMPCNPCIQSTSTALRDAPSAPELGGCSIHEEADRPIQSWAQLNPLTADIECKDNPAQLTSQLDGEEDVIIGAISVGTGKRVRIGPLARLRKSGLETAYASEEEPIRLETAYAFEEEPISPKAQHGVDMSGNVSRSLGDTVAKTKLATSKSICKAEHRHEEPQQHTQEVVGAKNGAHLPLSVREAGGVEEGLKRTGVIESSAVPHSNSVFHFDLY